MYVTLQHLLLFVKFLTELFIKYAEYWYNERNNRGQLARNLLPFYSKTLKKHGLVYLLPLYMVLHVLSKSCKSLLK